MDKVFGQKAVKWYTGVFFAFLACFLVSRGIYGALLARVQTETPSYKNLAHQVKGDGVFVAEEKQAVYGEEGLRIGRVFVKEGENVQTGTPLFQYDLDDLKKIMEEKEYELKKLQVQIDTDAYNRSLQSAKSEKEKKRAEEDLADAQNSFADALAKAESRLAQAQNEKSAFSDKKEYIAKQKEKDEGYLQRLAALEETMAAGGDVSGLKKDFRQYEKALKETLSAQWEQRNAELLQAVRECEEELDNVRKQNGQSVSQAERNLEDTKEDSVKESAHELNQMEAELLAGEIEDYQKIWEKEGVVQAETEAGVLEILTKEGERVQDGALLWLADFGQGVYFETTVSKDDKKYVGIGNEITIKKSGGETLTGKIVSVSTGEKEGQYTVQTSVEGDCAITENGTMELLKKSEKSMLAVPLSALHKENGNYFVYTASEENTILGTEWIVRKVSISIEDKNESFAAVSDGALSEKDLLITYSTKDVKEGDAVRLQNQ